MSLPAEKMEFPEGLSPLPFDPKSGALERARLYWPIFTIAGQAVEAQPHLFAAIGYRETRIQNILGDGGRGHGIMQLDTGSFRGLFQPGMPVWFWKEPTINIPCGAQCWQDKFNYLGTNTDLAGPALFWFATAAYNCGEGNMSKVWSAYQGELAALDIWDPRFWEICDSRTTGHDYATEVFRHYLWLLEQFPE